MAGHRTNLPLPLQQILMGRRSVSPALKLESEPPPKVKAFIDRVIKSPLHDIAIPLSGFRWEYNKGNFHHWRPLFMHFDTYFKSYISCRKDLLLSDDMLEVDPFPKNSVLQILRVMQIIMENCRNRSSFSGLEHFKLLLASTDPEIIIATLETLAALLKINPSKMHLSGKQTGCGSMNSCLLSLAQGWGSKEEGLGIRSCVVANERNQHDGLCLFPSDIEERCDGIQYRLGSTLHFEFNMPCTSGGEQGIETNKSANRCVIELPDLHLKKEDELSILKHCVDQFNVPTEHRFSLLTRIRYACAFRSPRVCRLYSRISILSFIALVQSSDSNEELSAFFANEPEYTNELIKLVRSEDSVPGNIRSLAMLALGAQLAAYASSHEKAKVLNNSNIISAGGNRMLLFSVLQKAVLSLGNPNDPTAPILVDALLQFFQIHVISSTTSGSAIRGSGIVPPLLPLLQDSDPSHVHLVCLAVKTLHKLMEYSSPAVALFKDLGGVELLAKRLQIEAHRVIGAVDGNNSSMISSDPLKSEEDHLFIQKRLIKALLKALGSATYSSANSARAQNSSDNSLAASLSLIFSNASKFGGDIYFSAVTLMSEIIHKDPTCFPTLDELGLPASFLSSVTSGVLPSFKALICIPNGLGAICLNAKGLEAVKQTGALGFLVETFTTRKYLLAMNEGVVLLANALEELLRHVSSLRAIGVEIMIEIIKKLASMGEEDTSTSKESEENTAMETDVEEKASEGHDLVSAMDTAADGINDEQFLHLCIFHVMVIVHRTMDSSETCRLFVEKGGIESLLKLLLRPSIIQSSEGMPIALHSTVVFKGFIQHHSAPLARAFSTFLWEQLKKALNEFNTFSGSIVLAAKGASDNKFFASLFVIEFLLLLAASRDNRWLSALLTEFGELSRDVLEDIGRLHREILWQIALFEDMKVEADSDATSDKSTQAESAIVEPEERWSNPVRQYLDPFLRRRTSGWGADSQFSDLSSFFRDLNRAASSQGLGMDGFSTFRFTSSSQSPPSSSSDGTASSKVEEDKQRPYNPSYRDMLVSLSYHISHLFMELSKHIFPGARRDNVNANLSAPAIYFVSTVASISLDHLNFEGHPNTSSEMEVSVPTKCRYLGKVLDFVEGILSVEKPESCNPIMVNGFYGRGVIQAILTTFEATSQLLFAVNRVSASPMETDEKILTKEKEEVDNMWVYDSLASYAMLMDRLATSSYILTSSTKQFLDHSIINGDVPFPRDAEAFARMLQTKVFKAILPIWTHPHFADCSPDFVNAMISIMRHVYSGVDIQNVAGNSGARLAGPPPDETTITMIVEMGFTRERAEEALRQVGSNSVEVATDWLFSHPEEPQDDDELARALAMSLGNSDSSSKDDEPPSSNYADQEEEVAQLPSVDEILSTCMRLLQAKESLAFSVRDLLVTISSQNDGQHRPKIVSFLIDHVRKFFTPSDLSNDTMLAVVLHVLALILHDDTTSRKIAFEAGLVKLALEMLSAWNLSSPTGDHVPKWVTACFLSIDRMLQLDPKMTVDLTKLEQQKKENDRSNQSSIIIAENQKKDSQTIPESHIGFLDIEDQNRLLDICCRCIQNKLPSDKMQVILQLCSALTKVHSVAVSFLDYGGLHALLNLPTTSLFSGFSNIAASIIRHILEDPITLQQAMESEIRHCLVTATSRHSSSRVTPRTFVQNLAAVISRDPVVFMKAAQAVCQIDMVGDRPYVVLLRDRDKDKAKDKDKDKLVEKEKSQTVDAKADAISTEPGNLHGKLSDSNSRNAKSHKKHPQSFTIVVEYLLDLIVTFVPPEKVDDKCEGAAGAVSSDMEVDSSSNRGKGKAIAGSSKEIKTSTQETSASLAKSAFVLKLLTEMLLTYSSSIQILLRRDAELCSSRGARVGSCGSSGGGIFHHILHRFLHYPGTQKKDKKKEGDWRYKLATRASQFLVASATRSAEGRRRVFAEIANVFNDFVGSSTGFKSADPIMHSLVDLANDVLSARSPTGSLLAAEASSTFVDVGLVTSLSRTLKVLDLDLVDSQKIVPGIIKALEIVTKEYHSSDLNSAKGNTSLKLSSDENGDRFQVPEATTQPDQAEHASDRIGGFTVVQTSGSSDSVTDDMDHDRDIDGGFAHEAEDDFMHEASEDGAALENGISTVEITFNIPQDAEDGMGDDDDDDDEDMSGDGDEVEDEDEDDEENNELEEDDPHQRSHPDTDNDGHEDGEFDDDEQYEDEEDEDEDEEVVFRLGMNDINIFEQIDVFRNANLTDTTSIPLDILGIRRQDRAQSGYNFFGRSVDSGGRLEHPLLEEPSSFRNIIHQRQSENTVDMAFSDRHVESASSRINSLLRPMRNGGGRYRSNVWLDDSLQRGGSNAPVPPGIEDFLISQLRRPVAEQPSDQNISLPSPKQNNESDQLQGSEREDSHVVGNDITAPTVEGSGNAGATDPIQESGSACAAEQVTDMHYERSSDGAARDVEAVSQASSGSGATLGESLRSLEVEIGSVDGHDDGDRQGPGDRLHLGDLQQASRLRRPSANAITVNNRDTSLESVSEVPPLHPSQGTDPIRLEEEQQTNQNAQPDSIDPTFLEALPEELRAEVLSSRQNQVGQPSEERSNVDGEIDPEFLAALPPDIREEVLAQQRAQRLHQTQELEGQPVEMDAVSIIATFPSEIREEVLLTSPDTLLATLTPALVAEANMLRERFAHRYHSGTIFGMSSRSRRIESSRREVLGSGLDRNSGDAALRRAVGKLVEVEGAPLVDADCIKAIIRVLRIVQPLYKNLMKLLLNLSAHQETRMSLMKILLDMLMLDLRGSSKKVVDTAESPFRLYGCQSYVSYSRPQFTDGVPPLVSRRILEILKYLASNHPNVAKLLLHLELPLRPVAEAETSHDDRGKAVIMEEDLPDDNKNGVYAIVLILSLLNQPLYMRSVAHLEQLLNLLDVIMAHAESELRMSSKTEAPSEQPSNSEATMQDAQASADDGVSPGSKDVKSFKGEGSGSQNTSALDSNNSVLAVLQNLPEAELRLLCSLLAREGLSDSAYNLVGDVLKKMVATAPIYCKLFITELANSVQNLIVSAMNELHVYGDTEKALVSSSSTSGTAILRVLQALSSLVSALHEKKDLWSLHEKDFVDALSQVTEIYSALESLWLELSNCISKIECSAESLSDSASSSGNSAPISGNVEPPLPAGTQNILPYIESFFVTCEKLRPGQSEAGQDLATTSNPDVDDTSTPGHKSFGAYPSIDEKNVAFVKFSEKHRKLLNAFIRQNPVLLEKSFSLLLKVPRLIEFDNKRSHFRSKIKNQLDHHHSPVRISVRRAYILEDSYNQLRMRSPQELKGRLTVHFQGEEGIDAGGLTREWYQLLSRVIFDKGALLFTTVGNESTFQPNPNSVYQTEHLSYFKFVGRVVGKALFDGQLLDVHFTRSFYKHILGVKVTYHDIEAIDPGYYKNLKWMLENDISDILDLTFSMDADEEKLILYERAEVTDFELIPGGRNIRVTEENKHEYVNRVAEHRLTTAIKPQINAFLEGFTELIPPDLISIFNDKELELLISGLPDIDLDDLRANTEYSGYSNASPVIQWFWEIVQAFSKEDKARFLQFVTGTSKVPLEGFSALQGISGTQRFQIHKAYGSSHHLPSAHTCFNQLDLPEYPSKDQLQEKLLLAIHEANEGFGFG